MSVPQSVAILIEFCRGGYLVVQSYLEYVLPDFEVYVCGFSVLHGDGKLDLPTYATCLGIRPRIRQEPCLYTKTASHGV